MPDPRPGEQHDDFIDRCIPDVIADGAAESHEQAVAICESFWEESTERAEADAPNYREADDNERCGTCRFAEDGRCTLYDFDFRATWTCDSWEPIAREGKMDERMGKLRETWETFKAALDKWLNRAIKHVDEWDGSASRWETTADYCDDCLINLNQEAGNSERDDWTQTLCKLPVREPGDPAATFVWEAVVPAAQALAGARTPMTKPADVTDDQWDDARKSAANKIITAYNQNDETAPDSVYEVAGRELPERAVNLDHLWSQVAMRLDEQPGWPWMHSVFYDEERAEWFAIASEEGRLYRYPVTVDGADVALGERVQVMEDFVPVATRSIVTRQEDGRYRAFSVSCTALLNKDAEIDSRALFDAFERQMEDEDADKPFRCFFHQGEQFRTGEVDFVARWGHSLVTSTLFDDTELGRADAEAQMREPEYWGDSIKYFPSSPPEMVRVADGVEIAVYNDGKLREVSTLPSEVASAHFTSSTIEEVSRMKVGDKTFEVFTKLFGDEDAALAWLDEHTDGTERAIEEGAVARAEEGEADDTPVAEVEESEVVLDDDALTEIVGRVAGQVAESVEALRTEIADLRETVAGIERGVAEAAEAAEERLAALETDEEERTREIVHDLPRRVVTKVTYRPRRDRAPGNGPARRAQQPDLAAAADDTLSRWPDR